MRRDGRIIRVHQDDHAVPQLRDHQSDRSIIDIVSVVGEGG